jgi:deazaflavin-dependent oxidoreductase (nitroreductase family)
MADAPVHDSPIGWVNRHITRYAETGGKDGHYLQGLPTLLLTTAGRRTGEKRRTGATYGTSGQDYVIIASDGGRPDDPAWFRNLLAEPHVEVQVGADKFTATARVATGSERARLWRDMVAMSPLFADLQRQTSREFPVIVLQRN